MNFLKEEATCYRIKCRISCRLGASNPQSLNSLRSEGWYVPRQPAHIAPSALNESKATNRAPGRLHFHILMYFVPLIHNANVVESCLNDLSPFLEFQVLVGLLVLPSTTYSMLTDPKVHVSIIHSVGPRCCSALRNCVGDLLRYSRCVRLVSVSKCAISSQGIYRSSSPMGTPRTGGNRAAVDPSQGRWSINSLNDLEIAGTETGQQA